MAKAVVLLKAKEGQSAEAFEADYLGPHASGMVADEAISKYVANVLREPTQEMLDAGWGWGGTEDVGILAIDEVWTDDVDKVFSFYDDDNVYAAYEAVQNDVRTCLDPVTAPGEKSPWIKRLGLMRKAEGMRDQDFFGYWKEIHGPKAFRIHNTARYEQNQLVRPLKEGPEKWQGLADLYYWNIDAFQYGHFSFPGAQQVIAEDVAQFQDKWLALPYGEEYIMKRG